MAKFLGKQKIGKNKIFIRYLCVYAVLFVFVGILLLGVYYQALNSAHSALRESYSYQLENAILNIEQLLTRCQNSAYSIANNASVLQLSLARPETLKNSIVQMNQLSKQMHDQYSLVSDNVASIILLYRKNNYIATNAIVSDDYRKEYPDLFNFEDWNAEQWRAQMLQATTQSILLPQRRMYSSHFLAKGSKEVLPLVVPVKSTSGMLLANIIYYLDAEKIKNTIIDESLQAMGFCFSLYNDSMETLLGDSIQFSSSSSFLFLNSRQTANYGLQICLGIPKDVFANHVSNVMRFIKIYVIVGLLGGVAITLGYAMYHTKSLTQVLHNGDSIPYSKSPYRYIQDVLQELTSTRDALAQELLLRENTYTNNLLINVVIYGLSSGKDLQEVRQFISMETFCIVILRIDAEYYHSPELLTEEKRFVKELGAISIHHRVEESVFIFPAYDNLPELISVMAAFGRIGLSQPCNDIYGIHDCYQQAYQVLSECAYQNRVCSYSCEKGDISFLWNMEQLTVLQTWIETGKTERVSQFFDNLVEKADCLVGINRIQHFFVLRQLLRRISSEMGCSSGEMDVLLLPQIDEAARDGLSKLERYAQYLAKEVQNESSNRSGQTANAVLSVIEAEFSNPSLSADYIAQRLNYSPKHIYHIVKEQTHKTVGEWILDTRLQFATELLIQTEKKNEEICQICGLGTVNTFYRVFRNKYGMTPGEFRKARKNGEIHLHEASYQES